MTKFTVILKVTKPDDSDAGDMYLYHIDTNDVELAEGLAWEEYCVTHDVPVDERDDYEFIAPFIFFGHQEDLLS
jgi:hypothetical protein